MTKLKSKYEKKEYSGMSMVGEEWGSLKVQDWPANFARKLHKNLSLSACSSSTIIIA